MPTDGELELAEEECFRLLATATVGRLALPAPEGEGLSAVPVDYVVDGESVVFRSGPGTKLDLLRSGSVVSFQVDELDPVTQTGWSVLVRGTASEVARGERVRFVRVPAERVSGRRLEAAALPWVLDSRAYL